MARVTRVALDLALVSLRKIEPVVSKLWFMTKNYVARTSAKSLVCNPIISTTESAVSKLTEITLTQMTNLRDRLLPREKKYLENELEKIKKRMGRGDKSAGKSLRPTVGTAWQYAKVEMVPPMTLNFFNGPAGKKLEESVGNSADGFIAKLQNMIHELDAEAERQIKLKEAEARAKQEKIKAEAKKKAAAERKEAEKLAAEAKKVAAAKTKEKEVQDAKNKSSAESAKKAQAKPAKKKETAKRKKPKKNRRREQKGSPPKSKK